MLKGCGAVDEAVPSATLLDRYMRYRRGVQVAMAIVSMLGDKTMLRPSNQGALADIELRRGF